MINKIITVIFIALLHFTITAKEKQDVKNLQTAAVHQQKAIYHFIQALKNTKKAVSTQSQPQLQKTNKEKNPFQDKQDFKRPKMPPEENPQIKLQKIIDMQNKVIEDLEKNKDSAKTTEKQEQVANAASKLHNDNKLEEAVKKALGKAVKSSYEASALMNTDSKKLAKIKAEKTLSDLKEAMRVLEKSSDDKLDKALAATRKKVNDLIRENEKNAPSETIDELKKMRGDLAKEAQKQHKQGTQKNADKLASLAANLNKRINKLESKGKKQDKCEKGDKGERGEQGRQGKKGKGQKGKQGKNGKGKGQGTGGSQGRISKELKEFQNDISKLQYGGKKNSQILAKAVQELQQLNKELKYLEKNPQGMSPDLKAQLMQEIEMRMQDLMMALKELKQHSQNSSGDETGKFNKFEKIMRELLEKQKRRGGGAVYDPLIYPKKFQELNLIIQEILLDAVDVLKETKSQNLTYTYNPDDIPPKYRKDVAKYFERLSNSEPDKKTKVKSERR